MSHEDQDGKGWHRLLAPSAIRNLNLTTNLSHIRKHLGTLLTKVEELAAPNPATAPVNT